MCVRCQRSKLMLESVKMSFSETSATTSVNYDEVNSLSADCNSIFTDVNYSYYDYYRDNNRQFVVVI